MTPTAALLSHASLDVFYRSCISAYVTAAAADGLNRYTAILVPGKHARTSMHVAAAGAGGW